MPHTDWPGSCSIPAEARPPPTQRPGPERVETIMTADRKLMRALNRRRVLGLPTDMLFSSPLFLLLLLVFIMIF